VRSALRQIAAFLATILATLAPAWAQNPWVEYRPAGEGFRVEFPGRPTVTQEDAAGSRYGRTKRTTASFELPSGLIFYASYIAYPSGTASSEPEKVLDTERLGRTAVGDLRNEQRFKFKGYPAQREVVDWHGPRPQVIIAQDVLRGDQLYSVYIFLAPGKESHPGLQRFIDSFDLLPE
jgi:hypothetical protein